MLFLKTTPQPLNNLMGLWCSVPLLLTHPCPPLLQSLLGFSKLKSSASPCVRKAREFLSIISYHQSERQQERQGAHSGAPTPHNPPQKKQWGCGVSAPLWMISCSGKASGVLGMLVCAGARLHHTTPNKKKQLGVVV